VGGGGGTAAPYMASSITATYRSNSSDVEAHSCTSHEINLFPFFAHFSHSLSGDEEIERPRELTLEKLSRKRASWFADFSYKFHVLQLDSPHKHAHRRLSEHPPAPHTHTSAYIHICAWICSGRHCCTHTVLLLRAHHHSPLLTIP
jgi:hypothetical protein